jgi:hypothetical protein
MAKSKTGNPNGIIFGVAEKQDDLKLHSKSSCFSATHYILIMGVSFRHSLQMSKLLPVADSGYCGLFGLITALCVHCSLFKGG